MVINDTLIYPAITLCYRNGDGNGFQPKVLRSMGLNQYWRTREGKYVDQVWQDFHWDNFSLSNLWNNATYIMYPLSQQLIHENDTRSMASNNPSSYNLTDVDTEERLTLKKATLNGLTNIMSYNTSFFYEYGRCYTFRPNEDVTVPPGSLYGYRFQFYRTLQPGNPKFYKPKKIYNGGWEVFVHDAGEYWSENEPLSDSQHEHFFVDVGYNVEIKLSQFAYFTMDRHTDRCNNDPLYSRTRCKERCRWQYLMYATNNTCSLPFSFPINTAMLEVPECKSYIEAMPLMFQYRQWLNYTRECNHKCLRKCDGRVFEGKVIRSFESEDSTLTEVILHFPSGLYTFLREDQGYDESMFLADLGGSLGFMLGISVITFLEFYDWVLLKVCQKCSSLKQRLKEKLTSKKQRQTDRKLEQKQKTVMKNLRRNLTIPDIILDKVVRLNDPEEEEAEDFNGLEDSTRIPGSYSAKKEMDKYL